MSNSIPRQAEKFALWLATFNSAAATYQAALGLSAQDLAALNHAAASVSTGIAGAASAFAASKAAHETKQTNLRVSEKLAGSYAKRIAANLAVSDAIKAELGIPTRKPATHTAPTVPTTLQSTGQANGTNLLRWQPNGNIRRTLYLIERQYGSDAPWTLLTSTTACKFADTGCKPGVKTSYRVRAKRRNITSDPSGVVTLYGS